MAGPEAYPLVIRVNPGLAMRPPLVWELELLEGCLRTIPEFLTEKNAVLAKTVAAASGKLTVRLSWLRTASVPSVVDRRVGEPPVGYASA